MRISGTHDQRNLPRPRATIDLNLRSIYSRAVEDKSVPRPAREDGNRVTISDIAKACGVTAATVSRVLNKKKQFSASQAVRDRIFETAEKLGYVPDLAARSLSRKQTRIVGIFASPYTHVAEGINERLLDGLSETFHDSGYDVFLEVGSKDPDRGPPFWRFDGAVLLQSPKAATVRELTRRRVPYVCVNEQLSEAVTSILADDAAGMRRAVDHLAQLGHRRVAYANAQATYFNHYSVPERYETLIKRSRELKIDLAAGHDTPFRNGATFLKQAIVQQRATAVITYDHMIAVSLVGAAGQMGLKIPDDFSLICFNDQFPVALLPVPLTAVAVNGREMGRIGADQLLNLLGGHADPGLREVRVDEELIIRSSTAPPRSA